MTVSMYFLLVSLSRLSLFFLNSKVSLQHGLSPLLVCCETLGPNWGVGGNQSHGLFEY
jgi:hypothetical protein